MPTSGSAGDLRERLRATRGAAYAVTSELGGGGMSRVFVPEEDTALEEGVRNDPVLHADRDPALLRAHPRFRQQHAPKG